MDEPLTGEQLFLRYAFPCAESRRMAGHIDDAHFARLEDLIKTRGNPKRRLLRFCFPHAYRRYREFARSRGDAGDCWSLEMVAAFWRHHHGHSGCCRVLPAAVIAVAQAVITVKAEEKTFKNINLYSLLLGAGDSVYLHRGVVIEKA